MSWHHLHTPTQYEVLRMKVPQNSFWGVSMKIMCFISNRSKTKQLLSSIFISEKMTCALLTTPHEYFNLCELTKQVNMRTLCNLISTTWFQSCKCWHSFECNFEVCTNQHFFFKQQQFMMESWLYITVFRQRIQLLSDARRRQKKIRPNNV